MKSVGELFKCVGFYAINRLWGSAYEVQNTKYQNADQPLSPVYQAWSRLNFTDLQKAVTNGCITLLKMFFLEIKHNDIAMHSVLHNASYNTVVKTKYDDTKSRCNALWN